MQKSIITSALWSGILALSVSVSAQSYKFEGNESPVSWKAQSGKLSLNTTKFKEGKQSLQWETQGKSSLNVQIAAPIKVADSRAYSFQLYSPEISNDTLKIELLNQQNQSCQSMTILLNFQGWRDNCRFHTEFPKYSSNEITAIRFIIYPTNQKATRRLLLDDVDFNAPKPKSRQIGTQWALDYSYFPANALTLLEVYLNPVDLSLNNPTPEEKKALSMLREHKSIRLQPRRGDDNEIKNALKFAQGLAPRRTDDNQITGKAFATTPDKFPESRIIATTRHLEVLADENQHKELFNNLLDHLLDQGFAEGVGVLIQSSAYNASRSISLSILNILPKCTPKQKVEVLKLCQWLSYYGNLYHPEDIAMKKNDSDLVYLYTPHYLKIALNQESDIESVRELRAFKRWMDRSVAYTPTDYDMLKPDGTGFHHGTHYNGYMYAYTTYATYLGYLKDTPFQVEKESYDNFRKAYITYYLMMTRAKNDNRFMAYSLSGRNPSSIKGGVSQVGFESLISAGDFFYGGADSEARAAYNYFFMTNKYPVDPTDYKGFFAFNQSPVGIYRGDGWTVTMRSPTSRTWGAEIYNATNRFGRYQSTGSLEVMYDGSLSQSGYIETLDMGGWDWNAVPGTTIVRYTNWKEMMPNGNIQDRFDQYTKTKDFSGALAWGKMGIYAADFDQLDSWGSERFTPTNLTFKKTVLAVDDLLISIGSDISASGDYGNDRNTVTNLFQSIVSDDSKPMFINGEKTTDDCSILLQGQEQHTLISPQKTAYILPIGNENLQVSWSEQSSPQQNGSDVDAPIMFTKAAKAYINHGVKTSDKMYQMVIVPNSTLKSIKPLADEVKKGNLYSLPVCTSKLHVIEYKPKALTTYTFFEAVEHTGVGLIKASDTEGLVLCKPTEKGFDLATCNPNRRPEGKRGWHNWVETPTVMTLTLDGQFDLSTAVEGISQEIKGDETLITIHLPILSPKYFSVAKK